LPLNWLYMFELLFQKVNEKIALTKEEEETCKTFFIPKKLRKKQYLLQQDDICRYTAFVEKGVLRSYSVDDKGVEHIVQFALEGWWIGDLYSFLTGEPSAYNIDALEDAELLLLTRQAHEGIMDAVPKFERFQRIQVQNSLISLQRRLVGSMSLSAEEKYTKLIHSYPDIIQRVPQHMIASYLGITPETLSRIRKQMIRK
jgi:CRP-like cAMP-binding protein